MFFFDKSGEHTRVQPPFPSQPQPPSSQDPSGEPWQQDHLESWAPRRSRPTTLSSPSPADMRRRLAIGSAFDPEFPRAARWGYRHQTLTSGFGTVTSLLALEPLPALSVCILRRSRHVLYAERGLSRCGGLATPQVGMLARKDSSPGHPRVCIGLPPEPKRPREAGGKFPVPCFGLKSFGRVFHGVALRLSESC